MSDQFQCPHCSGKKLNTEIFQIDSKTGSKINSSCGGIALLTILLFIVVGTTSKGDAISGIGVAAILVYFLFLIWDVIKSNQAKKRAYNLYSFYCQICGNRWEWAEGTPYPKIKVDLELIAKGNQLLEEQQRQQDAAALNYLLNKDK
jgi:transcription elongation factor Elf1